MQWEIKKWPPHIKIRKYFLMMPWHCYKCGTSYWFRFVEARASKWVPWFWIPNCPNCKLRLTP